MPAPTFHTPANPVFNVDVNGNFIDLTVRVAEGTPSDAAYSGTGNATTISGLKGIFAALLAPTPAGTNSIGAVTSVAEGGISDTAYTGAGNTTTIGALKGIYAGLLAPTPAGTNNIGAVNAVGNVASGAADAGNPVKIGGIASAGAPTAVSGGSRVNAWYTPVGAAAVAFGQPGQGDSGGGTTVNVTSSSGADGTLGVILRVLNSSSSTDRIRDANTANATTGLGLFGAGILGRYRATALTYTDGQYGNLMMSQAGVLFTQPPVTTASTALSGTIASSGATATVSFISTARQEVINPSTSVLWASWGNSPAVNGAGSFQISPGGSFSADRVTGTLTLLSTAATQPYTVNRYS